MELFLICALTVILYLRTLNYSYVIDDNVKRDGYMYEVPLEAPPADLFKTRPSAYYRLFMIGMHCVNVSVIYLLWGWCPALLFAVHPIGVWGTAWVTGNYYATTAYFTLIAYYVLHTFPNIWGALVAMPIFAAALNSTICCISFPFLYFFAGTPWGISLFVPLGFYLYGKRFNTGIKIRDSFNENRPVPAPPTFKRLFLMTKVMAKYIQDCVYPDKLGFFGPYGHGLREDQVKYDKFHSADKEFWIALVICLAVAIPGMFISKVGTVWFFVVLALHSQWRLTGQFYAQRYLYLPLVGLAVIVGTAIQSYPLVVTALATFLVLRTHIFIGVWKNMECVYRNDLDCFGNYSQVYNNMAQYYMSQGNCPPWRINEIGALLFKAEEMEPNMWAIKMNIACYFAMLNQWEPCLEVSKRTLELVKPLGGPRHPITMLENQIKSITQILEDAKKQSGAIVSPERSADAEKVGT